MGQAGLDRFTLSGPNSAHLKGATVQRVTPTSRRPHPAGHPAVTAILPPATPPPGPAGHPAAAPRPRPGWAHQREI